MRGTHRRVYRLARNRKSAVEAVESAAMAALEYFSDAQPRPRVPAPTRSARTRAGTRASAPASSGKLGKTGKGGKDGKGVPGKSAANDAGRQADDALKAGDKGDLKGAENALKNVDHLSVTRTR